MGRVLKSKGDVSILNGVKAEVLILSRRFPLYPELG